MREENGTHLQLVLLLPAIPADPQREYEASYEITFSYYDNLRSCWECIGMTKNSNPSHTIIESESAGRRRTRADGGRPVDNRTILSERCSGA